MTTATPRDEIHFPKGAVIFRQGDPGHEMFVIAEGRVRLTLGAEAHEKEIGLFGRGEFFGELSLLSGAPRTATAQAVEDTTLLAIGRDVFKMMVEDDLDIVFRMMNIEGQRLSNTNRPIEQLTQQLGHVRIVAYCLKRFVGAQSRFPFTADINGIAAELQITPSVTAATFAELADAGAGVLEDHRWSLNNGEQLEKLTDALCRYAAQPSD
jgi:CRP-like cAMP-binding protein